MFTKTENLIASAPSKLSKIANAFCNSALGSNQLIPILFNQLKFSKQNFSTFCHHFGTNYLRAIKLNLSKPNLNVIFFISTFLIFSNFSSLNAQFQTNQLYCISSIDGALPIYSENNIPTNISQQTLGFLTQNKIYEIRKAFKPKNNPNSDFVYLLKFVDSPSLNPIINSITTIPNIIGSSKVPIYKTACTNEASGNWNANNLNSYTMKIIDYCNSVSSLSTTNTPVKLAIVDNAFNITHTDFTNGSNNMFDALSSWDVSDNDANVGVSTSMPFFMHGTLMAGISGAKNNNSQGIASPAGSFLNGSTTVNPIKLVGIKATPDANTLSNGASIIQNAMLGIDEAADVGAKVILAPFYSYINGSVWNDVDANDLYLTMLNNPNFILVVPTGNDNLNLETFPAGVQYGNWQYNTGTWSNPVFVNVPNSIVDRVIAVSSLDPDNSKAYIANYGSWVDISANGTDIYSTIGNATNANQYLTTSGTSNAAALVASSLALYAYNNPTANMAQLRNALLNSAVNVNGQNPSVLSGTLGTGKLDLFNLITNVNNSNTQINLNLSSTHFCMNAPSTINLGITNLPFGVTVTGVNWSIPGATPSTYNTQNITISNFPNGGIYVATITLTLSNSTTYKYRTGLVVHDNTVQLLSQSTNPVCKDGYYQIDAYAPTYGSTEGFTISGNFNGTLFTSSGTNILNSANNMYNTNTNLTKFVLKPTTTNNPTCTVNYIDYFKYDYTLNALNYSSPVASCPILNSSYVYSVMCCDNSSTINGDFSNTSTLGFTTTAYPNPNYLNYCNSYKLGSSGLPFSNFAPNASGGNQFFYNGPYDMITCVPCSSSYNSGSPQNITFSPPAVTGNGTHQQIGKSSVIWQQPVNLINGASYNFSGLLASDNFKLSDIGLPFVMQVKITNGSYSVVLPKKTYNTDEASGINAFQDAIANFGGPSGTYTVSVEQVDNFGVWYFNTWFDDFRFQQVQLINTATSPCSKTSIPYVTNPPANNYFFTNTSITINTNTVWKDIDLALKTPGITITVLANATLTINSCRLHGCTNMWQGIIVNQGGKVEILNNSLIEDAIIAVNVLGNPLSGQDAIVAEQSIFNKNVESIVLNNYSVVSLNYPYQINNCVFTNRDIGILGCDDLPPNWVLTGQLLAPSAVSNNLSTPYLLASIPYKNLNNGDVRATNHIRCNKVGNSFGPLTSLTPSVSFLNITNKENTYNIFDNAKNGILLENSNAQIRSNIFQNCETGIATNRIGTTANPGSALHNYWVKITSMTSSLTGANQFYDNKAFDINLSTYTWQNISFNNFRSTQSKTNVANFAGSSLNNIWPPNNLNTTGKYAIAVSSGACAKVDIAYNEIYNHYIGIALSQAVGAGLIINSFMGKVDINNNKIWDKPALNMLTTPFIHEAIACDLKNLANASFINSISNPYLKLSTNDIQKVYTGIIIRNYNYKANLTTVNTNTISLVANPSTSNVGTQQGIWSTNGKFMLINSNTVNGIAPTPFTANTYSFFANAADVKARASNFKFSDNKSCYITCNTSNQGVFGFEFNGASNVIDNKWQRNNQMNNQHYIGYLLNNMAIIGQQGSSIDPPINNKWTYTNTGNTAHTFTDNTQALNSRLFVTSGGSTTPTVNLTNVFGNQYQTNNSSLSTTNNAINNSCILAPTPAAINTPIMPELDNLVNGTYTFAVKSVEGNYAAKLHVYQLQLDEPAYQTLSPALANFYNIANAPTHPYRKIMDIQGDLNNANYTAAQTKVNAFTPSNEIESNYKIYFNLAIKYFSGNVLSATEQTSLLAIANKCAYTNGTSTYLARTIYNSIALENGIELYPFYDDCNVDGGLYKTTPSKLIASTNFDAFIYPNPNKGSFIIDCTNANYNDALHIEIVDVLGRVLYNQTHKANMGIVAINALLLQGNYIVRIRNAQGIVINKKMIAY